MDDKRIELSIKGPSWHFMRWRAIFNIAVTSARTAVEAAIKKSKWL